MGQSPSQRATSGGADRELVVNEDKVSQGEDKKVLDRIVVEVYHSKE